MPRRASESLLRDVWQSARPVSWVLDEKVMHCQIKKEVLQQSQQLVYAVLAVRFALSGLWCLQRRVCTM